MMSLLTSGILDSSLKVLCPFSWWACGNTEPTTWPKFHAMPSGLLPLMATKTCYQPAGAALPTQPIIACFRPRLVFNFGHASWHLSAMCSIWFMLYRNSSLTFKVKNFTLRVEGRLSLVSCSMAIFAGHVRWMWLAHQCIYTLSRH